MPSEADISEKERNRFFYTGDSQLFFEFSVCATFSNFNTNRLFSPD